VGERGSSRERIHAAPRDAIDADEGADAEPETEADLVAGEPTAPPPLLAASERAVNEDDTAADSDDDAMEPEARDREGDEDGRRGRRGRRRGRRGGRRGRERAEPLAAGLGDQPPLSPADTREWGLTGIVSEGATAPEADRQASEPARRDGEPRGRARRPAYAAAAAAAAALAAAATPEAGNTSPADAIESQATASNNGRRSPREPRSGADRRERAAERAAAMVALLPESAPATAPAEPASTVEPAPPVEAAEGTAVAVAPAAEVPVEPDTRILRTQPVTSEPVLAKVVVGNNGETQTEEAKPRRSGWWSRK
jgi:ribonuclease E